MALAVEVDVQDYLGRELTDAETAVVDARLTSAELLVFGFCGQQIDASSDCAATVIAVEAEMVARAFEQAASGQTAGVDSVQLGAFSTHFVAATQGGGVWLATADKLKLRFCRRSVTAVGLVGPRYTITES